MQKNIIIAVELLLSATSMAVAQSLDNNTVIQEAPADSPVWVYGSANEGNGRRDNVLVEQNNEANPLGDPIDFGSADDENTSSASLAQNLSAPQKIKSQPRQIQEDLPQNPPISAQESPQAVNKQIQNTLYVSGGRIYDIQSYPVSDINYIEQPNLNPAITTYPAY